MLLHHSPSRKRTLALWILVVVMELAMDPQSMELSDVEEQASDAPIAAAAFPRGGRPGAVEEAHIAAPAASTGSGLSERRRRFGTDGHNTGHCVSAGQEQGEGGEASLQMSVRQHACVQPDPPLHWPGNIVGQMPQRGAGVQTTTLGKSSPVAI